MNKLESKIIVKIQFYTPICQNGKLLEWNDLYCWMKTFNILSLQNPNVYLTNWFILCASAKRFYNENLQILIFAKSNVYLTNWIIVCASAKRFYKKFTPRQDKPWNNTWSQQQRCQNTFLVCSFDISVHTISIQHY